MITRIAGIGLSALFLSLLTAPGVGAQSQTTVQTGVTQTKVAQGQNTKFIPVSNAKQQTLSERDRLIQERRLQKVIPAQL